MQPAEVEKVQSRSVSCNGMETLYDHPLVYLEIDQKIGYIDCPYCGKKFEL